jgi:hypothetical protein
MSTEISITLTAAILAFITSIIGIIVSGYNARFRRYALEKWWEKKYDAYSNIIDALSDMVEYYRRSITAEEEGYTISDTVRVSLQDRWLNAIHKVNKATSMGAFLISTEAEDTLRQFRKDFDNVNPRNWFEDYSNQWDLADKCLKELTIIARKDLDINTRNTIAKRKINKKMN